MTGPSPLRLLPPAQPAKRPGAIRGGAGLAAAPAPKGGDLPPGAREQGCVLRWYWTDGSCRSSVQCIQIHTFKNTYVRSLHQQRLTTNTQCILRIRPREQEAGRAHRQLARVALRRGDRLFVFLSLYERKRVYTICMLTLYVHALTQNPLYSPPTKGPPRRPHGGLPRLGLGREGRGALQGCRQRGVLPDLCGRGPCVCGVWW